MPTIGFEFEEVCNRIWFDDDGVTRYCTGIMEIEGGCECYGDMSPCPACESGNLECSECGETNDNDSETENGVKMNNSEKNETVVNLNGKLKKFSSRAKAQKWAEKKMRKLIFKGKNPTCGIHEQTLVVKPVSLTCIKQVTPEK